MDIPSIMQHRTLLMLVLILALVYYRGYTRVIWNDAEITIVQLRLDQWTPSILQERRPILITDRVVDPARDLAKAILPFWWTRVVSTCHDANKHVTRQWTQVSKRASIVAAMDADALIDIGRVVDASIVRVHLRSGQCMVLHRGWFWKRVVDDP